MAERVHEGGGRTRPGSEPVLGLAAQIKAQPIWEHDEDIAEEAFRDHEDEPDYMSEFCGLDEEYNWSP